MRKVLERRGLALLCALTMLSALPLPLLAGAAPVASNIYLGPIDGLTTRWHRAPEVFSVPAGTTLTVRRYLEDGATAQWTGIDRSSVEGEWSYAERRLDALGPHRITVLYGHGVDGVEEEAIVINVEPFSLADVRVQPARPSVDLPVIRAANPNASTYQHFLTGSIAALRPVGPNHFRTSVQRSVRLTAEVQPVGLAPLLEWRWREGGETLTALGDGARFAGAAVGSYEITFGPQANPGRVTIDTYRTHITSHRRGVDQVGEGEEITFRARTEPEGLEDEITWLAGSRFGTMTPLTGKGAEFTVRFDETFGGWNPRTGQPEQWIGVMADNDIFDQLVAPPGTAFEFDFEDGVLGPEFLPIASAIGIQNGELVVVPAPGGGGVRFNYPTTPGHCLVLHEVSFPPINNDSDVIQVDWIANSITTLQAAEGFVEGKRVRSKAEIRVISHTIKKQGNDLKVSGTVRIPGKGDRMFMFTVPGGAGKNLRWRWRFDRVNATTIYVEWVLGDGSFVQSERIDPPDFEPIALEITTNLSQFSIDAIVADENHQDAVDAFSVEACRAAINTSAVSLYSSVMGEHRRCFSEQVAGSRAGDDCRDPSMVDTNGLIVQARSDLFATIGEAVAEPKPVPDEEEPIPGEPTDPDAEPFPKTVVTPDVCGDLGAYGQVQTFALPALPDVCPTVAGQCGGAVNTWTDFAACVACRTEVLATTQATDVAGNFDPRYHHPDNQVPVSVHTDSEQRFQEVAACFDTLLEHAQTVTETRLSTFSTCLDSELPYDSKDCLDPEVLFAADLAAEITAAESSATAWIDTLCGLEGDANAVLDGEEGFESCDGAGCVLQGAELMAELLGVFYEVVDCKEKTCNVSCVVEEMKVEPNANSPSVSMNGGTFTVNGSMPKAMKITAKVRVNDAGGDDNCCKWTNVGFVQNVLSRSIEYCYGNSTTKTWDYNRNPPLLDAHCAADPVIFDKMPSACGELVEVMLGDSPAMFAPKNDPRAGGAGANSLSSAKRTQEFITWVVCEDKHTKAITYLNYTEWKLDYNVSFTYNAGTMTWTHNTTAPGGVQSTGGGNGQGPRNPVTTGPTSNNSNQMNEAAKP